MTTTLRTALAVPGSGPGAPVAASAREGAPRAEDPTGRSDDGAVAFPCSSGAARSLSLDEAVGDLPAPGTPLIEERREWKDLLANGSGTRPAGRIRPVRPHTPSARAIPPLSGPGDLF